METKKFGFYFLLFIILALAVKFYIIISVFLPAIATACVFAYLFYPIYGYILKITKRKSLSAFIIIFIIFSMVFVPLIMIIFGIQKEISLLFTEETYNLIKNASTNLQNMLYNHFSIDISDYIATIKSQLTGTVQSAVTVLGPKFLFSITGFALSTFITIFIMFYILTDSKSVIATFKDYFPLSNDNCDKLLHEVSLHTRALVLGQLLIAIMQGTLVGIGFLVFSIPGALLWGFVTVIMTLIPLLGTMVVWFPAGLIQLAQHNYLSGIGILLWGGLFVGNIDNIVRPKLTSSFANIHPVTVLLGVLIGLKEWGLIGLVLGPLLITILLVLIRMFREEYEEKPKAEKNE
jgi:predicted PurR-regulated permease PerM